jgi:hypothetical protein
MLQLYTYIIGNTHTNYKKKEYNRENPSSITFYIIIPSQTKHGKFQNPNKTRHEIHKQKYPPKCATFTYTGKETTYITKIFQHTNIKIAYLTNNTNPRKLNSQNP